MSLHDDTNAFRQTPTTEAYISRWKSASQEQDKVLSEVLARNLELETRVKSLEYENWTIRKMLEKCRADSQMDELTKQELKTRIDILNSEQESFRNENPLIVCLMDGDGCIFSADLLRQGQAGGIAAAQRLSIGVNEHLRKSQTRIPPGVRVVVMMYLSMIGVQSALLGNEVCTPEQFFGFFHGFGGAHPLISVVDCGTGKEAADHKIREFLDLFIRLPQTFKIFFGGGHDNGYHGTLAATQTLGLKEKIVILQSYAQLGREIGSLNLPILEIPGLFMSEKLERRPLLKKTIPHSVLSPVHPTTQNGSVKKTGAPSTPKTSKAAKKKLRGIAPQIPQPIPSRGSEEILVDNHTKGEYHLPCLHHNLSDAGCEEPNCPFDHQSMLTDIQLQELKEMALMIPCRYVKNNRPCPLKECHFGHSCPQGASCEAYKCNKCSFVGLGMHG